MKVLQINTIYKDKSTGRTCWELEKKLVEKGHECVTAFGHGKRSSENTYRINTDVEYFLHNILSRVTGLEGYFSYFATRRLIRFIKRYSPDVIHLRNLHGHYLNLPLFFKFLKKSKIPVVMHLHDCWIMTGKCCYPVYNNCNKWQTQCENCPSRKVYPVSYLFDFSKKMHNDKKKWFSKIEKCTVVGVSDWIAGEGKKSYLNKFPVTRVYNWINTDVFHPYEDAKKSDFGLDEDKFTLVFSGASWVTSPQKVEDMLALADLMDDDMQILLIGKTTEGFHHPKIKCAGFVGDVEQLAKMYSVGDAYIHVSTADTFGKVIAEAMACGLPAVVYDNTACPELVSEGCGAAVEPHNIEQLINELQIIKKNGKAHYSEKCKNRVKNSFSYDTNVQQTLEIYNELISK